MDIEEINDAITEAINRATQKVTAKQNQNEEKLTDKIKEMLRDRRELLERGEWRTVEFVELNKLIRRSIKESIRNKHEKMINEVIERNLTMKVV